MKDMATEMPGMARVRARFLEMLAPRQEEIALEAVSAWEAQTSAEIKAHLVRAQSVLHQISGSAGSLGFATLGAKAHACENRIIAHFKDVTADHSTCPGHLIVAIDDFLTDCRTILAQG